MNELELCQKATEGFRIIRNPSVAFFVSTSVIGPRNYSFQILSAFLSASCFHLRFDIARYAFNAGCRTLLETNTNKI